MAGKRLLKALSGRSFRMKKNLKLGGGGFFHDKMVGVLVVLLEFEILIFGFLS